MKLPGLADVREVRKTTLRSTGIGPTVGILPAEGITAAAILGGNETRRRSKTPEEFGKGCIEGVAGPGTADNSGTSGAMVPPLAPGIPGGGTTAVILAAPFVHGLRPGPFPMTRRSSMRCSSPICHCSSSARGRKPLLPVDRAEPCEPGIGPAFRGAAARRQLRDVREPPGPYRAVLGDERAG